MRESVRINEDGFEAFLGRVRAGPDRGRGDGAGRGALRRARLRPADDEHGADRARVRDREDRRRTLGDFVLPSLEVAGPGMHWVEVSRAIGDDAARGRADGRGLRRVPRRRADGDARRRHRARRPPRGLEGFTERGYHLGHVTGHSIGMTMIEHPRVGEGLETVLRTGMVLSMHPHAIAADGQACLYMQDTWLVGRDGGEPLSRLPMRVFEPEAVGSQVQTRWPSRCAPNARRSSRTWPGQPAHERGARSAAMPRARRTRSGAARSYSAVSTLSRQN